MNFIRYVGTPKQNSPEPHVHITKWGSIMFGNEADEWAEKQDFSSFEFSYCSESKLIRLRPCHESELGARPLQFFKNRPRLPFKDAFEYFQLTHCLGKRFFVEIHQHHLYIRL